MIVLMPNNGSIFVLDSNSISGKFFFIVVQRPITGIGRLNGKNWPNSAS